MNLSFSSLIGVGCARWQRYFLWLTFILATSSIQAKTILVMGDSLSAAYNLRSQDGWVHLMSESLDESHPDVSIINASVSGETSQGGLARLPTLLEKHTPDIVVLELGANDALRGYPLDRTRQNLDRMITMSQAIHAQVLLIGNRLPPNYGRRYTEQFFNLYAALAEQHSLDYVPFMLDGVALNDDLMQADGLHPNAAGQPIVLANIMPLITTLLSK